MAMCAEALLRCKENPAMNGEGLSLGFGDFSNRGESCIVCGPVNGFWMVEVCGLL